MHSSLPTLGYSENSYDARGSNNVTCRPTVDVVCLQVIARMRAVSRLPGAFLASNANNSSSLCTDSCRKVNKIDWRTLVKPTDPRKILRKDFRLMHAIR